MHLIMQHHSARLYVHLQIHFEVCIHCVLVCALHTYMCVCVCVCVREREREIYEPSSAMLLHYRTLRMHVRSSKHSHFPPSLCV